MERESLSFVSGDATCAAWLYHPAAAAGSIPCVVMGHGFSLTRHDGLATYAEALAGAGAAVLVFDHRYLGDSGGLPRQRFRSADQLEDYRSAIAYVRRRPEIDPARIVVWGFSFSGGTAINALATDPSLAGGILLCPFTDGLPRLRQALRQSPGTVAWLLPRAIRDAMGAHNLIPVTAEPGGHGAMNFPGEASGFAAALGTGSPWRNEISPGVFTTVAFHRPVTLASRILCPVWVGLGDNDISVDNGAVERFATDAPRAELHRYDADHFEPFYGETPTGIAADQAEWIARTVVSPAGGA